MTVFASSKFTAPPGAAHHVSRTELIAHLDARDPVLRLVTGSPGSGKTTLLTEWFGSRPVSSVCWLRADAADHDPLRFWSAVVASVRTIHHDFGAVCLDLLALAPLVDHDFLEGLIAAGGLLAAPVDVVVDDFHLVGHDVQDHLRFLLARGCGGLRFVIGTRVEPDIGLDRLRLADQVAQVGEAHLRFDEAAARTLLHHLHADVPDDSFRAVMERTEGWAAGLHLTALALRASDDPHAFVVGLTGSTQPIAPYLWTEVYGAQTPEVQRFLLDTCVVDELTPALAAARTTRSRSLTSKRPTSSCGASSRTATRSGTTSCSSTSCGCACAPPTQSTSTRCTNGPPAGTKSSSRPTRPSATAGGPASGPRLCARCTARCSRWSFPRSRR